MSKEINHLQDYVDFYNQTISLAKELTNKNNSGGEIRHIMGKLVEDMLTFIWEIETGGQAKKNDYVTCKSKSGKHSAKFQVDRHCYIDGEFVAMGECKAYLDRCYMERASSDFSRIREGLNKKIDSFILALEDAVKEESFKYIMEEGNIDEVFFLLDGKRKSSEPIWSEKYKKDINIEKLSTFVKYVNLFNKQKTSI